MISQKCLEKYDEEFASGFEQFLNGHVNVSASNDDVTDVNYLDYVKIHLKAKKCPSTCSRLWLVDCLLMERV